MQPKFGVEEKVLCYHGPLLYEAKILKMKKEAGIFTYFVHYQVAQPWPVDLQPCCGLKSTPKHSYSDLDVPQIFISAERFLL